MLAPCNDFQPLDDADLARLRTSTEDHFVERIGLSDWRRDAVKTIVAFANSLPIGAPGYLFIGVRSNGEVEGNLTNNILDGIQKKLAELLKSVHPRIYYVVKGLTDASRPYLVVIVPGSMHRPHFSGPAFVREGSETKEASEEQYRILIAERTAKVYELRRWIGKQVVLHIVSSNARVPVTLVDCNQFYLTWRTALPTRERSVPIDWVLLSSENDKLQILVSESH